MISIRKAQFNRKRFDLVELELWKQRTGARILRCWYTEKHCHVIYRT